jgi:hypothetical protein
MGNLNGWTNGRFISTSPTAFVMRMLLSFTLGRSRQEQHSALPHRLYSCGLDEKFGRCEIFTLGRFQRCICGTSLSAEATWSASSDRPNMSL